MCMKPAEPCKIEVSEDAYWAAQWAILEISEVTNRSAQEQTALDALLQIRR